MITAGSLDDLTAGQWMVDRSYDDDQYYFATEAVVYAGRTAFQQVDIVDTVSYGRALLLDGILQSAQDDEHVYHEALVHPAMIAHPDPQRVLIIGGGEGATLREALAYRSVRRATMVDIDPELVAICKEHLQSWHRGSFDDSRSRVIPSCGREFVERTTQTFDVAIVDLTDGIDTGPVFRLFTREFYECLKRRLRPGGIATIQAFELTSTDFAEHAAVVRTLRSVFRFVRSYRVAVPSFSCSWGFVIASDAHDLARLRAAEIDRRIECRLDREVRTLDGATLASLFVLPKDVRQSLARLGPILEDDRPEAIETLADVEKTVEQAPPGARRAQARAS